MDETLPLEQPAPAPPQDTAQLPPEQLPPELAGQQAQAPQAPNPFDTQGELAELELLQNELAQSEAGLEANFAKYASEQVTPELEELFYDNKEQFFIELQKLQNQFYQDTIASKQQRAQGLQQSIAQKQLMGEIDSARVSFESESGADVNTLLAFYDDFVPNAAKRELENLPPKEFFAKLWELYQANMQSPEPQQPQPPERIAGNAAPSANLDYNADLLPTERY